MKYKEVMWINKYGFDHRLSNKEMIKCLFRFDPIPCSGDQWWQYRAFRYGTTIQEIRRNEIDNEYVRGKRKSIWLRSDPYDDGYYRSDHRDNSWKCSTKRRNQWK